MVALPTPWLATSVINFQAIDVAVVAWTSHSPPPSPGWIRYIAKLANGKLVFDKYFQFLEELVAAV